MFQIVYTNIVGTNLYEVRLLEFGQTIVVGGNFLIKNIGIDPRAVVGCKDISYGAARDLGFVVEREDVQLIS